MDSNEFYEAARAYFAIQHGGRELVSIVGKFVDGTKVEVELPLRTFADRHGGMSERELLFMNVIPDSDKPSMTAKQLAAKAGYTSEVHVKRVLKSMLKKRLVVMDDTGYRKAK